MTVNDLIDELREDAARLSIKLVTGEVYFVSELDDRQIPGWIAIRVSKMLKDGAEYPSVSGQRALLNEAQIAVIRVLP